MASTPRSRLARKVPRSGAPGKVTAIPTTAIAVPPSAIDHQGEGGRPRRAPERAAGGGEDVGAEALRAGPHHDDLRLTHVRAQLVEEPLHRVVLLQQPDATARELPLELRRDHAAARPGS